MSQYAFVALGFAAILAAFAVSYAALLAFNSPHKPRWLAWPGADNAATIALMVLMLAAFAWPLAALEAEGADPLLALSLVALAGVVFSVVLWRKLHMRERLEAARNGMSPFAELRHIRQRQRAGHGRGRFGPGAAGAA